MQNPVQNQLKTFVINQFAKLMTTCVVLRMEDFTLYKVTTSGKKQALKEFIAGIYINLDALRILYMLSLLSY